MGIYFVASMPLASDVAVAFGTLSRCCPMCFSGNSDYFNSSTLAQIQGRGDQNYPTIMNSMIIYTLRIAKIQITIFSPFEDSRI